MNILVLISGNGTNLQYLIDNLILNRNCNPINNEINIIGVLSNKKNAYGLKRANDNNISTFYCPFMKKKQTREEYDNELSELISSIDYDLIVCAGWMHVLSDKFLSVHPNTINLHPSLPNTYKGINCIRKMYDGFKNGHISEGGIMVHWVVPEIDSGEVIYSHSFPMKKYEYCTYEQFEKDVHEIEQDGLLKSIYHIYYHNLI